MPTRARNEDINEMAHRIGRQATEEPTEAPPTKNPAAVALGRLGASKGGHARAKKLSKARRRAIARKAAVSRWDRRKI